MTDGAVATYRPFEEGHDPGNPIDRSVMATMRATFPSHGLVIE
jgi:acetoin utilization protein AcuC